MVLQRASSKHTYTHKYKHACAQHTHIHQPTHTHLYLHTPTHTQWQSASNTIDGVAEDASSHPIDANHAANQSVSISMSEETRITYNDSRARDEGKSNYSVGPGIKSTGVNGTLSAHTASHVSVARTGTVNGSSATATPSAMSTGINWGSGKSVSPAAGRGRALATSPGRSSPADGYRKSDDRSVSPGGTARAVNTPRALSVGAMEYRGGGEGDVRRDSLDSKRTSLDGYARTSLVGSHTVQSLSGTVQSATAERRAETAPAVEQARTFGARKSFGSSPGKGALLYA
jgi:hypothetical protein